MSLSIKEGHLESEQGKLLIYRTKSVWGTQSMQGGTCSRHFNVQSVRATSLYQCMPVGVLYVTRRIRPSPETGREDVTVAKYGGGP